MNDIYENMRRSAEYIASQQPPCTPGFNPNIDFRNYLITRLTLYSKTPKTDSQDAAQALYQAGKRLRELHFAVDSAGESIIAKGTPSVSPRLNYISKKGWHIFSPSQTMLMGMPQLVADMQGIAKGKTPAQGISVSRAAQGPRLIITGLEGQLIRDDTSFMWNIECHSIAQGYLTYDDGCKDDPGSKIFEGELYLNNFEGQLYQK